MRSLRQVRTGWGEVHTVTESGSRIQRGMGITTGTRPYWRVACHPATAAYPRSVARTASCNSSSFHNLICGNDTSPGIS